MFSGYAAGSYEDIAKQVMSVEPNIAESEEPIEASKVLLKEIAAIRIK